MSQRSADLTGTDQCNFVTRHRRKFLDWLDLPWSVICSETGVALLFPRLRGH
jgi:hypothetical protein